MKIEEVAFKRGYRVTTEGKCLNPKGEVKGSTKYRGYLALKLRVEGRSSVTVYIHRLQAFQKYGEALYEQGVVVRHLNSNKEDNSWDNVAVGTQSDNMLDIPEQERIQHAVVASSYRKKYNNEEVKKYYRETKSYKRTMEQFNIGSKGTLHYILNA